MIKLWLGSNNSSVAIYPKKIRVAMQRPTTKTMLHTSKILKLVNKLILKAILKAILRAILKAILKILTN